MTETKKFNCITCPRGCELTVTLQDGKFQSVTGNFCPNGAKYAEQEVTAPMRMLTGTVKLTGAGLPLLPVVSTAELPKDKILLAAAELRKITVAAPVKYGDIIIHNILGLGVDMIASCDFACIK
ncbi:MAG: DUF1667 domain-containing protein [Phascolarctobacterium sp.]|nr:DUF1667 domain-containing protein [Candidatus Phascolarctobacterium caballi]